MAEPTPPKVFISYSWTSPEYRELILEIADRLMNEEHVDVIIDEYDLTGGQELTAFMERLTGDTTVSHVLIMSNAEYAAKADGRIKGVGTEAQIISPKVYADIGQTRVVPILMEVNPDGTPCLPTFLVGRVYYDFSSAAAINHNWEKVCRHLWGKPARPKPPLGPVPSYVTEGVVGGAFSETKQAWRLLHSDILTGKNSVPVRRVAFLDALDANLLSFSKEPGAGEDVIAHWLTLLKAQNEVRDLIVDWQLMEATIDPDQAVKRSAIPLLEKLTDVPDLTNHDTRYPASFLDAMSIFRYEIALNVVACYINVDSPLALKTLLNHPFKDPHDSEGGYQTNMQSFNHHSRYADRWNEGLKQPWTTPLAHIIVNRISHPKIDKIRLCEAEACIFLINVLNLEHYYPHTAAYNRHGTKFPWFQKAKATKNPDRLALLTDLRDWSAVRDMYLQNFREVTKGSHWGVFRAGSAGVTGPMGLSQAD